MKIDFNVITNWKFLAPMAVALISLAWSGFNFVFGKAVATKITQNDIKHITADIDVLKTENKEIKIDLKQDLEKIFKRLGKIDKGLAIRDAICNERHKKN